MILKHYFAFCGLGGYLYIFGGFETLKFLFFSFLFNDVYSHFPRPMSPNRAIRPFYSEGRNNLLSNLHIWRTHHFQIVHQFGLQEYFILQRSRHRFQKWRVNHCSKEISVLTASKIWGRVGRHFMSAILEEAAMILISKVRRI